VRVLRFSIGVGAVLCFAVACGGGGGAPTTGPTSAGPTQAPGEELPVTCGAGTTADQTNVTIANFAYDPSSVTVDVGAIVQWKNNDTTAHTVTFDQSPDCSRVEAGQSTGANFHSAGTYAYHCTIHPSMKGTVVVQ
jgi:plastocyanin